VAFTEVSGRLIQGTFQTAEFQGNSVQYPFHTQKNKKGIEAFCFFQTVPERYENLYAGYLQFLSPADFSDSLQ